MPPKRKPRMTPKRSSPRKPYVQAPWTKPDIFDQNDLCFVKIRGSPYWPARIEECCTRQVSLRTYYRYIVYYFGTHETGTVKPGQIIRYTPENAKKHGTYKGTSQGKCQDFLRGMEEIEREHAPVTEIFIVDSDDSDEIVSVNCNPYPDQSMVRTPMVVLKKEEIDEGGDSDDDLQMDSGPSSTVPLSLQEEKSPMEKTIIAVARGHHAEDDSSDGPKSITCKSAAATVDTDVEVSVAITVPVQCMLCKITYLSITKLAEHIKNQHNSCGDAGYVLMYTCCFCNVSVPCNNVSGLASHIVTEHKDPVEILDSGRKNFKCPFCVCSTNLRKNMIQHVSSEHLPKPYQVDSNMAFPAQSQQFLPSSAQPFQAQQAAQPFQAQQAAQPFQAQQAAQPFQAQQPAMVMQQPQPAQLVSGNLQQAVPLQQPVFYVQQQLQPDPQPVQQPIIEPVMQTPQQRPTIVCVESGRDVNVKSEKDDDDVVVVSN